MKRYTFSNKERISESEDFKKVLFKGRTVFSAFFTLFFIPSQKRRLGILVSRRLGNAVVRNRIKRLVRQAYRLNKDKIKEGYDIIVKPKKESTSLSFHQVERYLSGLFRKARIWRD